jgi:tetratricopeptide (TPR) repeat protein
MPILSGALLTATGALEYIALCWSRRDRRGLLLSGLGLLAAFAVAYPVRAHKHFDDEYWKLGAGYHEQKRLAPAERAYLQALAYNREHVPALHNLAALYEAEGRSALAAARWQELERLAARRHDAALVRRAQAHLAALRARAAPQGQH